MTPRRLMAYHELAERRRRRQMAEQLFVGALAARGKEKTVDKLIGKWSEGVG